MKYFLIIPIALLFSCNLGGQSNKNINFKASDDTILYVKEMSKFLDTAYLNRYEEEIKAYEKSDSLNGIKKGRILFFGSSSFRKWNTMEKDLYPLPVLNRGFGGSTMPEAVYYFSRMVLPYKPSAIMIYEGDNDLTANFLTPDVVLMSFKLFVLLTERYLPDTHIFFVSIKPSPAREEFLDKMLITNMLIKEYCDKKSHLHYIDITEQMFDSQGNIRTDIFVHDKLHLNDKGYQIWTDKIKVALLMNNIN